MQTNEGFEVEQDLSAEEYELEGDTDESVEGEATQVDYSPSIRSQVVSTLIAILSSRLVWYVAGIVDGIILFKLFGK